jgi:hypothetical protein
MTTEQIVFRKDDVWLCQYGFDPRPLVIKSIRGNYIKHRYCWESAEEFKKMALVRLGTVRRICGIPFGIKP